MKSNVYAIVDLQFGSTGKGLLAGYLAEKNQPDAIVTAFSPNAGHTYIGSDGEKFIHTMLGNGTVAKSVKSVFIGAGAVVNLYSLKEEIENMRHYHKFQKQPRGGKFKVYIHEHATIVNENHRQTEARIMMHIGSTAKGTGQAMIEKILRQDISHTAKGNEGLVKYAGAEIVSAFDWLDLILKHKTIQIEGAQGFSLGINQGFYPYCTSRECTIDQLSVDTGIPGNLITERWGTLRSFPIRVANRHDQQQNQIGWSGGHYYDQQEIEWEDLGIKPELTTVTQLPRRIFSFSYQQIQAACLANGITNVFFNFMNYVEDVEHRKMFVDYVNESCFGAEVSLIGYGATYNDIEEQQVEKPISNDKINDLMHSISDWADSAFPKRTPENALKKLVEEEIPELYEDGSDPGELADVLMIVLDLFKLHDVNPTDALKAKLEINKVRNWKLKDGVYKHV